MSAGESSVFTAKMLAGVVLALLGLGVYSYSKQSQQKPANPAVGNFWGKHIQELNPKAGHYSILAVNDKGGSIPEEV